LLLVQLASSGCGGALCTGERAAATLATRGRQRRTEGSAPGGGGGLVGARARNGGEAVEGGGTPSEARAAAPCQEPAEETLGSSVLGRRSVTPPARGPERTNGGEAAADGTEWSG